ncbi:FAD:protein FMN transferase [Parasporobacterium paucivorans]|uniref:FAD:protein FMN transferase n=1 Tax=Parasporobacterium paucivorans DSM 15970 TaxID=1122934 RepID=A0A1M6ACI6_9FIRM|nr:FAD:protein FMN transferase [Parasporobacterium paucivorans]SHI34137.1 thiamine biosynthesis lipoprotein [Parasporobacterium paucivorans DSM 15970]
MKKTIIVLALLLLTLTGCSNDSSADTVTKTDFYFDTVVTITLYGETDASIIDECFSICAGYEQLFSRTIETSEISILNRDKILASPSPDTLDIINTALQYSALTDGKFDITVAGLSQLWAFTSDNPAVPGNEAIKEALKGVGSKYISINDGSVRLTNPATSIDLGALAKGYIADKLKEYLLSQNVKSAVIDLGGNVLLVGSKPDGSAYRIGIQKPFAKRNESLAIVQGSDISIVSSGNYERYFYENGKLYHHILDTTTGYPVENNLSSVTILSSSSLDGDCLSTSCFALGLEKGMELIESLDGIEAVFVDKDDNMYLSSGLKKTDGNIITISPQS